MAVARSQISGLLAEQLRPRLRYRCVVLQTGDIPTLSHVCEEAIAAAKELGVPRVLEYLDQFDEIGAVSCRTVVSKIEAVAASQPVVIAGPLHYVDYWSDQVAASFWWYLASFMSGPGIIVVDTMRQATIESAFRIIGYLPETEVRYLKSRLATTQDGLV